MILTLILFSHLLSTFRLLEYHLLILIYLILSFPLLLTHLRLLSTPTAVAFTVACLSNPSLHHIQLSIRVSIYDPYLLFCLTFAYYLMMYAVTDLVPSALNHRRVTEISAIEALVLILGDIVPVFHDLRGLSKDHPL